MSELNKHKKKELNRILIARWTAEIEMKVHAEVLRQMEERKEMMERQMEAIKDSTTYEDRQRRNDLEKKLKQQKEEIDKTVEKIEKAEKDIERFNLYINAIKN